MCLHVAILYSSRSFYSNEQVARTCKPRRKVSTLACVCRVKIVPSIAAVP